MSAVKFVATDLDGTILPPDAKASERTRTAIGNALDAGIAVSVCTARSPRSAVPIARELGLTDGFAICGSGSMIFDVAADRLVHRNLLPLRESQTLIERLRKAIPGVAFSAEIKDIWHREEHYVTTLVPPLDAVIVDDALRFLDHEVTKVNIRHADLHDEVLFSAVSEAVAELGLNHVITSAGFVEILGPGIDKAVGVAWVADALGVGAEEVITFGDDLPDVPMLAWAGRGVAVENAHPDVLSVADEVCGTVADDGVAIVLESLLKS